MAAVAANDQTWAELSDADCEGAAQGALVRVGAEQHSSALAPHALARALGLQLSASVPAGCRGLLEPDCKVLRFDGRGTPEQVSWRVAHELGHYAGVRSGLLAPHPEGSIDRIAAALVMPRAAVRLALRRVGFDPVLLLADIQGPPPAWVLVRAAWVAERSVIVRFGAERWAYAPNGGPVPGPGALERELVEIVGRTGHPYRTLLGHDAWPVVLGDRRGVVISPA